MRCFIAIEIPEELKERIKDVQKRLNGIDTKLVEPENLHFNLKFLGDIESDKPDKISKVMDRAFLGHSAFKIRLKGLGVFPDRSHIRILWMGVLEGRKELLALNHAIEKSLSEELGIHKELKPFEPHITLARIHTPKGKDRLLRLLDELAETDFGEMTAKEIKLFESNLTPNGPVYRVMHTVRLGG